MVACVEYHEVFDLKEDLQKIDEKQENCWERLLRFKHDRVSK